MVKVFQIFTIILLFTSCKSTKSITENKAKKPDQFAVFQVKSLKAINLEEELTFADEVVLTYSLTAVDENNKVVQVANGPRGPYFCREVLRNPPAGFRGSEADGSRRYSVVGKRAKQVQR